MVEAGPAGVWQVVTDARWWAPPVERRLRRVHRLRTGAPPSQAQAAAARLGGLLLNLAARTLTLVLRDAQTPPAA